MRKDSDIDIGALCMIFTIGIIAMVVLVELGVHLVRML